MNNNKKKAVIAAIITMALCLSVIAGATFALLTSKSTINIVTTAGDVDVVATLNSFKTYSFGVEQPAGEFENDGTATLDTNTGVLTLERMTPGDKAVVDVAVTNASDIAIKYSVGMEMTGELAEALEGKAVINGSEYDMHSGKTVWFGAAPLEAIGNISISIEFPGVKDELTYDDQNTDNQYSKKSANVALTIYAVQGNAQTVDEIKEVTASDFASTLADLDNYTGDSVELEMSETIEWETGAAHGSTPFVSENATVSEVVIEGNGNTITATGDGVGPIRAANEDAILIFRNVNFVDLSESYAEDAWEFTYLEFAGNLIFENCTFNSGIAFDGVTATFNHCTFVSTASSEYSVWVSSGNVRFTNCTFAQGTRAAKIHEDYGSEVVSVSFDNCTFGPLSEKPGVAIGTLNADTTVSITNCTFNSVQAGDQGMYIYESDTDVTTFNFVLDNNTVN